MLSVGEMLKKERERKGIILPDIEKQIRIREKFLRAVEENDWNFFSSKVYVAGVIRNYAIFLGMDPKKILAFFRRDYEKTEEVRFKRKLSHDRLAPETKRIFTISISILFIVFAAYFGYQLTLYFSPPKVVFIAPTQNTFKREDKVKIIGKTDKDALITIFNERVYQNKEGIFEFNLPLKKGNNEVFIEVIGANGKKVIIHKTFTKTGENSSG